MCDTAEDMDDFIEYELARDCIEIDDDIHGDDIAGNIASTATQDDEGNCEEFLYPTDDDDDGYEIVEELEDEDEQTLISQNAVDIKPEILDQAPPQEADGNEVVLKTEIEDCEVNQEDHLVDEIIENGYINEDEVHEIEFEEIGIDDEATEEESESVVPDTEPPAKKQKINEAQVAIKNEGPPGAIRRYMLYDELVACIVDYDPDGTPIVEFSISNCEADEKLPMECGICPDVMPRARIPVHIRTHIVPGTTNRFQCIYCEETYKDCKYLAGHARRHMGIRPYVCELCKLYFSTKQDLRVHNQRRHQEKFHICELCGKTFAQNTQLKRHREATHEKKRRFQCDHCTKSYYKNFSLQEHIRAVHMGKRRIIVCPFCGMQCRDAHKMARHRKQMHLHQTHFECHICSEEFTDINYFDAHKRSIQCRNNTRRKQEEEGLLQQQEEEQQLQQQEKHEILIDDVEEIDETSQQYSQHSAELNQQQILQNLEHHLVEQSSDDQVQIIDEADIKHLLPSQINENGGQFNELLQNQKVEVLTSDDVAEDEELVYEITIDSNE